MKIELTRFKVKEDKSSKVDEWLQFLNDNMNEVLLTLDGEKMYVESIFREQLNGEEYLYWFSIQGTDGQNVETSEHWVDIKHLEYWYDCIDETFQEVNLTAEVVMIPDKIKKTMI